MALVVKALSFLNEPPNRASNNLNEGGVRFGLVMALTNAFYSLLIFPSFLGFYFSQDCFSFSSVGFCVWRGEALLCSSSAADPSGVPKEMEKNPGQQASRENREIPVSGMARTELPLNTALPAHIFPYFNR